MFVKRIAIVLMVGVVSTFATLPAWSSVLSLGGSISSPDSLTLPSGPAVAESSSLIANGSTTYGTLYSEVVGTPGNYDFLYQFKSNGVDPAGFNSLTTSVFSNLTTDVGWTSSALILNPPDTYTSGGVAPSGVNRSVSPGAVINWNFSPTVTGWSDVLIVATNSKSYTPVSFDYTSDSTYALASAYGPAGNPSINTPEPACVISLFGLVSMCGIGLVWRRRQ